MALEKQLLEVICCPACQENLTYVNFKDTDILVCQNSDCRRAYFVDDDIPVLLLDESKTLEIDEHREALKAEAITPKSL